MAALEAGKLPGAGQQGVAHRRGAGRAEGPAHAGGRDRPGRLRALRRCTSAWPRVRATHRRGPAAAHRVGRPVPRLAGRAARRGDRGRRAGPSDLVDGAEDHHRLVDAHEQGPRGDRGPRALRHRLRPDRHRRAPAVDRALHGGAARRVDAGPAVEPRHAPAHRVRAGLARPRGDARSAPWTGRSAQTPDLRAARPRRSSAASTWPTRPGRRGGSAPAWLSAANEVAVEAFLGNALPWGGIADVVAETMDGVGRRPGGRGRRRAGGRRRGPGPGPPGPGPTPGAWVAAGSVERCHDAHREGGRRRPSRPSGPTRRRRRQPGAGRPAPGAPSP